MKRLSLLVLLGLFVWVQTFADDTEIYLNPSSPNAADPLVMLTIDWRPNLGSSSCSDFTSTACETSVGSVIYPHLVANITEFGVAYRDSNGDGDVEAADGDEMGVEPFDLMRAALRALLNDPGITDIQVGLMISHDDTCNGKNRNSWSNCSNGGYVVKGFTPLTSADFDASNTMLTSSDRYALLEKLGKIPAPQGNVSHPYQLREIYYEFIKYLTGGKIFDGHLGSEDYASTFSNRNLDQSNNTYKASPSGPAISDTRDFAWDSSIESGSNYISPYSAAGDWSCSKTYIINTYFNDNQQSDSDSYISAGLSGLTLSGGDTNKNEQLIDYLNTTDMANGQSITDHDGTTYTAPSVDGSQTVQSYFISASNSTNQADGYAFNGGTGYAIPLADPTTLLEDLQDIFEEILSVSTTFVAASVPVNVFNRTEVVDNVYYALFKAEATPRWNGNLKKLKILEKTDLSGETYLDIVSAEGAGTSSAISDDGRIRDDALTFWTDANAYDVQAADSNDGEVVGFDGRSITRGGAGQQIPGFVSPANNSVYGDPGLTNSTSGARKLYTDTIPNFNNVSGNPVASSTLLALDANSTTASTLNNRLGVHSDAEAETLLQWIRGFEVDDGAYNASTNKIVRSWLLGDPIHSRPIAVNYGVQSGYSTTNPKLRIFMGSNDGFMRAFKDTSSGSNATGEEIFAYMPNELMLNNQTLRYNTGSGHPYGVDSAPVSMVIDVDNDGNIEIGDGDKVYIYFGLRRGGRAYYALDVSNPSDTAAPTLAWKIKKPVSVSGNAGFVTGTTSRFQTGRNDLTPGQLAGGRLHVSGSDDGSHVTPTVSDPFYHILTNDADSIYVRQDDDGSGGAIDEFISVSSGIQFTAEVYGSSDFSEMGMTFSDPKVGLVKYDTNPTAVLIFGGGYDPDKDNLGNGNDDEGVAIYIVNAQTGALIWKAIGTSGTNTDTVYHNSAMVDSIPSTITTLDSDGNGYVDRLYVGDTGGNVWRVDLPEGSGTNWRRDNWFVSKLADLGSDAAPNDRRFFHSPDIVLTRDSSGRYDGVVIASGNRPSPKRTDVTNYLYVIKDRITTSGSAAVAARTAYVPADFTDITSVCITGVEVDCGTANLTNGWRMELEEPGEKGLSAPVTAQGTIFFTTYLPEGESSEGATCAPSEGSGRIYAVNLKNGSIASDVLGVSTTRYEEAGSGIPPGATPLGSDSVLLPGKGIGGRQIVTLSGKTRWRTYWREIGIDQN